jgi:hypothetical protein
MRRIDPRRRTLLVDAVAYLGFAAFAGTSALWSQFADYRIWGSLVLAAYLFGVTQALLLAFGVRLPGRIAGSRWTPVGLVAALGMVIPLVVLVLRRAATNHLWSEQPEVWVVERGAALLLHTGTPYASFAFLHRPPTVADYVPYGPAMAVFGLPRAIFGPSAVTDARVMFALVGIGAIALALRLTGYPVVPVRALQLAVACPLTALTFAIAGDDLPIAALTVLAIALLHRGRVAWSGTVIAIAVSMKLIAGPAAIVLAVAVFGMWGMLGLRRFAAAAGGTTLLLTVPVCLVDPTAFIEQVVRFPLGMGLAHSPAASPLPGQLISRLGPVGHGTALALLAGLALAMAIWLYRRPPRTAAAAAARIATGLAAAVLLAPATRYGYLIYPCVLLATALTLRAPRPAPIEEAMIGAGRGAGEAPAIESIPMID